MKSLAYNLHTKIFIAVAPLQNQMLISLIGSVTLYTQKRSIKEKLIILELAQQLGNVSKACRLCGMSRTQYYEYKRRYISLGIEGLKNLPPIHKHHPQTTPSDIIERIIELSLIYPNFGCARLRDILKSEAINISAPTLQRILTKNGMRTVNDRIIKLEEKYSQKLELNAEQIAAIEKINPCFRERHTQNSLPGELLVQDILLIGTYKNIGRIYLQVVVDTFDCYAFAHLSYTKTPILSVNILHNSVLPFYRKLGCRINGIITSNKRDFCGKDTHPYELFLSLHNIEHRIVNNTQPTGFIERFYSTVSKEFFRAALHGIQYHAIDKLQIELDTWLTYYNTERPFEGYPNMGRTPMDIINLHI